MVDRGLRSRSFSEDESENEWVGSDSECEDWDEEYESDDG